jgi:hypothetical protein
MNKLGLIGQQARAADLAVAFYNALRAEIVALTGGALDPKEVEQAAVSAALDTFAAIVSNNPDASEALTEGIVRVMAMEFHRVGLGYESATAKVLAAFQVSWLALDEAREPVDSLPSRAEIAQRVEATHREANELVDANETTREPRYRGTPAAAALAEVERITVEIDSEADQSLVWAAERGEALKLAQGVRIPELETTNFDRDGVGKRTYRLVDPALYSWTPPAELEPEAAKPNVVQPDQRSKYFPDAPVLVVSGGFGVLHAPECPAVVFNGRCDCGAMIDSEAMALGDPPLFCLREHDGKGRERCVDAALCDRGACLAVRSGETQ